MSELETALWSEYQEFWSDWGIEIEKIAQPLAIPEKRPLAPTTQPALRSLEDIQAWLGDCRRCPLCNERNQIVFGTGDAKAKLLFVGEAPGAEEDIQGLPFVGKAGELLTKMIEAMGFKREDVYIANTVKCRPPGNRVPAPEEVAQCLPFLKAQIEQMKPRYIVALGLTAANALLQNEETLGTLRGKFHPLPGDPAIQVLPTYHPAYLLRNPAMKKTVWEDLKQVLSRLEK